VVTGTPARRPLRVAAICTGNICRSPMAEVVLRELVERDDQLRGAVRVTSAGTARWHVGSPMDPRARSALDRAGLTAAGSPARFAGRAFLEDLDVALVMTREHRDDVAARRVTPGLEILLLRNILEPGLDLDLADPYYGDDRDFDECLETITRAGQRWVTSESRRRPDGGSSSV